MWSAPISLVFEDRKAWHAAKLSAWGSSVPEHAAYVSLGFRQEEGKFLRSDPTTGEAIYETKVLPGWYVTLRMKDGHTIPEQFQAAVTDMADPYLIWA